MARDETTTRGGRRQRTIRSTPLCSTAPLALHTGAPISWSGTNHQPRTIRGHTQRRRNYHHAPHHHPAHATNGMGKGLQIGGSQEGGETAPAVTHQSTDVEGACTDEKKQAQHHRQDTTAQIHRRVGRTAQKDRRRHHSDPTENHAVIPLTLDP